MATIELQQVTNFRDMGGIPTRDGRFVSRGLLFRGGALAKATASDCEIMFEQLGIACVVDLRCGWERDEKPDVVVEGVENLHIPFYDLEKVGIEYTEPAAGTKVVGRDVACDPDRFYRSLANPLTVGQMREGVNQVFAHVLAGKPVYQHCSGGKDRTGILALLVLSVLGADEQAILDDYLATNESRDKNLQKEFERFLRFANGDEERAHELTYNHRARPENLTAFYEAVQARYGGVGPFIRNQLGFSDARIAEIREACTTVADR